MKRRYLTSLNDEDVNSTKLLINVKAKVREYDNSIGTITNITSYSLSKGTVFIHLEEGFADNYPIRQFQYLPKEVLIYATLR